VDTYTFTAAGSPWISFAWLSEVGFFLAFRGIGLAGILLLYSALVALIFIGVYYRCCDAGADCKDAAVATLGAICLSGVSLGPRTLLFGWLCMVGLLLVLDHFRRTGEGLWLLPPLFAVWINLHASWLFGIAVLAITIVAGLVEGEWGLVVAHRWSSLELKKLLLVGAVSLAALFVNPFGYKLALFPLEVFLRQGKVMQNIQEMQSVDFSTGNGKLALMLIFALLAAAWFSRYPWRMDEVMLTVIALWAALVHARSLFFAGLIIVPILSPRLKLFPPYQRKLDKPWLNAVIMGCIVGSIIFFFPSSAQLQQNVAERYPAAALAFMQRQHLNGRIFNEYRWGGYMEWNAPELKPFIDGRFQPFVYNGILKDYGNAVLIRQPLEILDKYRIEYALLEPEAPLTYVLRHSTSWRLIYSDQVAVLFKCAAATAGAVGP
jgi:hypothetical protein